MKVDVIDRYSVKLHLVATAVRVLSLCIALYVWIRGVGAVSSIADAGKELNLQVIASVMNGLYIVVGIAIGVGFIIVTRCKSASYKLHKSWKVVDGLLWAEESDNKYVLGTEDKNIKFYADSILTASVDRTTIVISNGSIKLLSPAPPAM